jgi:hypothetical protein
MIFELPTTSADGDRQPAPALRAAGKSVVKRPNGTRLKNRESAFSGLRVTSGRKRLIRSRVAFTPTTTAIWQNQPRFILTGRVGAPQRTN